ncbi:hypothetical protein IQ06DRAFT_27566 [Phaeosphaeriaceae sp. SRC1lsM3a]|nr:hypothetical protein IQ06DRAFT_27566 [Stagonospora sp. SRC1lsM3a]
MRWEQVYLADQPNAVAMQPLLLVLLWLVSRYRGRSVSWPDNCPQSLPLQLCPWPSHEPCPRSHDCRNHRLQYLRPAPVSWAARATIVDGIAVILALHRAPVFPRSLISPATSAEYDVFASRPRF